MEISGGPNSGRPAIEADPFLAHREWRLAGRDSDNTDNPIGFAHSIFTGSCIHFVSATAIRVHGGRWKSGLAGRAARRWQSSLDRASNQPPSADTVRRQG